MSTSLVLGGGWSAPRGSNPSRLRLSAAIRVYKAQPLTRADAEEWSEWSDSNRRISAIRKRRERPDFPTLSYRFLFLPFP
jgi:hypothetical protein